MTDIELFQEKHLLVNKIELTPTSLKIIGDMNEDDYGLAWTKLALVHGGTQWWIGDLYNAQQSKHGTARVFAEKHGLDSPTVRVYASVCSSVEVLIRINSLTFAHHQLVAPMSPAQQKKWLKRAGNNSWTVKEFREEIKQDARDKERAARLASAPIAPHWSGEYQPNSVYIADTTEMDFIKSVPKDSMDMVFTDPPWDEGALICYETVGRLANRVLKPGGFAAVYCGKMFLPEILSMLSSWLDYVWMYCVFQPDNNWSLTRANVGIFEAWRPIALFRKPGDYREQRFAPDALKCTRQKQWHDWQQGIEPIEKYIELLTEPGDIVLDPFVGGATVPYAAMRLKRHYLAFDKEEETVRLALARLNGRGNKET